jgi:hypothetical protein
VRPHLVELVRPHTIPPTRRLTSVGHQHALNTRPVRAPPHITPPTPSQIVFRTSNVGHHQCEQAAEPLPTRAAAWQQLGGWAWTAPPQTPEWFGKARQGQGVADRYDGLTLTLALALALALA